MQVEPWKVENIMKVGGEVRLPVSQIAVARLVFKGFSTLCPHRAKNGPLLDFSIFSAMTFVVYFAQCWVFKLVT